MRIMLPVDPGFAFDYLAILHVKKQRGLPVSSELIEVRKAIESQCDSASIMAGDSVEFFQLIRANSETFDLVEMAKKDQCKASEVDAANYRRYLAKKALQERFWPSEPILEQKTERP